VRFQPARSSSLSQCRRVRTASPPQIVHQDAYLLNAASMSANEPRQVGSRARKVFFGGATLDWEKSSSGLVLFAPARGLSLFAIVTCEPPVGRVRRFPNRRRPLVRDRITHKPVKLAIAWSASSQSPVLELARLEVKKVRSVRFGYKPIYLCAKVVCNPRDVLHVCSPYWRTLNEAAPPYTKENKK
jgi:hypothetical protein